MSNDEKSLSDQHTFSGGDQTETEDLQSLGDQQTNFSEQQDGPASLGDELTLGDNDQTDGVLDDDMEIIDLSARYRTESIIGKGGMGEVVLAIDTRLNRKVAIKRMLGNAAQSKTAVNRFLTEAQSIAALNHPNIVQIYDYGRAQDGPFLIMEYVEGNSLLNRCREGALPVEEAVELTSQLCDGLERAHEAGIIHRDIKPANILLTRNGIPKLTDFGLAKDEARDSGMTITGVVLGTMDFMPPEQREDASSTDARSDLWSLGATLYQLVTGKTPKVIKLSDVPKSLQGVLSKALEDNKEDRFQSADEFRAALKSSLDDSTGLTDLDQGECPHCGTNNEASRKYCRNCAGSLEVQCLSCSTNIPVWEEVCGNCGHRQSELLEKHRQEMAVRQAEAESLLKKHEFNAARNIAETLLNEPDLRLQHLKNWADSFLQDVDSSRIEFLDHLNVIFSEALQHERAYDYSAGIHVLEQVPAELRSFSYKEDSETITSLLERLKDKKSESRLLELSIKKMIKKRDLDRLPGMVDRLLTLRPDRSDLQKLRRQLDEREEKRNESQERALRVEQQRAKARSLLKDQRYEELLNLLDQENPDLPQPEVIKIRKEAENKLKRLQLLQQKIDRLVEQNKSHDLLESVREYLSLNASNKRMQQLENELLVQVGERLASEAEEQLEEIQRQRAIVIRRYQIAGAMLALVLLTVGIFENRARLKADQLSSAIQEQNWDKALAIDSQSVPALIGRARQRLEREPPDVNGAFADLKEAELADFTASSLKPAKALVFAKRAIINADAGKIIEAKKDLREAELLGATDDSTTSAKQALAMAYVKRAIVNADAGKIIEAEKGLREAELLGATDDSTTSVKQALALAYVKRAQSAVQFQDLPGIRSAYDSAEEYQAEDEVLTRLRAEIFLLEGKQRREVGDYTGALRAFDEAHKINSVYEMKTARAEIHLKLAQQALEKKQYIHAMQELESAITLDDTVADEYELALRILDPVLSAIEANMSNEIQLAAVEFLANVKTIAPPNHDRLLKYWDRLAAVYLKHGVSARKSDPDADLQDIDSAMPLGADTEALSTLKNNLIIAFSARLKEAIGRQEREHVIAVFATLAKLDLRAADRLVYELENVPVSFLTQLPPDMISRFNMKVLSQLPPRQNSIGMSFKLLVGGTFIMGADSDGIAEKPLHHVKLTTPYEIGVNEVTQEQYQSIMGTNPSKFNGPRNPVEMVSWNDAIQFCQKLSELPAEKDSGYVYRLPTEAEWEYACRAGTTTRFSYGDSGTQLGEYAWYFSNSNGKTHPVGQKKPNPWGLYDMHGNVWEWCHDWYGDYSGYAVTDPQGASTGLLRVNRGGSWRMNSGYCHSAIRYGNSPGDRENYVGFRIVRISIQQAAKAEENLKEMEADVSLHIRKADDDADGDGSGSDRGASQIGAEYRFTAACVPMVGE